MRAEPVPLPKIWKIPVVPTEALTWLLVMRLSTCAFVVPMVTELTGVLPPLQMYVPESVQVVAAKLQPVEPCRQTVPESSGRAIVRLAVRVVVLSVAPKLLVVPSAKTNEPAPTVPDPAIRPKVNWPLALRLVKTPPAALWISNKLAVWVEPALTVRVPAAP